MLQLTSITLNPMLNIICLHQKSQILLIWTLQQSSCHVILAVLTVPLSFLPISDHFLPSVSQIPQKSSDQEFQMVIFVSTSIISGQVRFMIYMDFGPENCEIRFFARLVVQSNHRGCPYNMHMKSIEVTQWSHTLHSSRRYLHLTLHMRDLT